ncbi:MAG: HlyD family secretion protein [Bacteroidota bacterium]
MKTAGKWLGFFLLILAAVIVLLLYISNSQVTDLQLSELTGSIEAEETDVNVKIPGRVKQMEVEEGDEVSSGQTIAVMEAENIEAKAMLAKAAVEAATAQYQKAKNGARPQQREQARNLMDQAKAGYDLAQSTYNRLERLYKEGVLAEQKLDVARTELEIAEKRYLAAKEQYEMVEEGAQREDLEAAAALVKQAEAAYAEVQSYLKDSTVTAPLAGTITMKAADQGELVSTGMPLVTICNLKNVWVMVKVRETAINQFKIGQVVKVRVIGVPNRIYQGKVTYIAPKPSFATERAYQEKGEKDLVAFSVKIKLDNSDLLLRPGMTAAVNLNDRI